MNSLVPGSDSDATKIVLTHAILHSLASWIPVPLLDDYLQDLLAQKRTLALYKLHGLPTPLLPEVKFPPLLERGFWKVVKLPAKIVARLFRKLLLPWQIKIAADQLSREIHIGYLIDYALAKHGTGYQWQTLQQSIDQAYAKAGSGPVTLAVESALEAATKGGRLLTGQIASWFQLLVEWAKNRKTSVKELDEEPPSIEKEIESSLFYRDLTASLAGVFGNHFSLVARELDQILSGAPVRLMPTNCATVPKT